MNVRPIAAVLLSIALTSCAPAREPGQWQPWTGRAPYEAKLEATGVFSDAIWWPNETPLVRILQGGPGAEFERTRARYRYIPEAADQDHWQTQAETEARQGGDCEDLAVALALELQWSGFEPMIVVGRLTDRPGVRHVWVELGGVIYDPALRKYPLQAAYNETRYVPAWAFGRGVKYKWREQQ